ncbi:hypothetical protein Gotur_027884 [Gossypium turneri]
MECKDIPERFTIRTVSPHLPDDKPGELKDIKDKLTKNWPNLYVKKNEEIPNHLEIWKHIWKQHGMHTIPNYPHFYFGANTILYKLFRDI